MDRTSIHERIHPHLPDDTSHIVTNWILAYDVDFRISKPRRTKIGDYRHPWKGKGHRISVNADLNPYSFLITTVHEFAHLKTWVDHEGTVKPHGPEWKAHFSELLRPFYHERTFPSDIEDALHRSFRNPKASTCSDKQLYFALRKYDQSPPMTLEDIEEGEKFRINRLVLIKGKKRRTRYKCRKAGTMKFYLVNELAEIEQFAKD